MPPDNYLKRPLYFFKHVTLHHASADIYGEVLFGPLPAQGLFLKYNFRQIPPSEIRSHWFQNRSCNITVTTLDEQHTFELDAILRLDFAPPADESRGGGAQVYLLLMEEQDYQTGSSKVYGMLLSLVRVSVRGWIFERMWHLGRDAANAGVAESWHV